LLRWGGTPARQRPLCTRLVRESIRKQEVEAQLAAPLGALDRCFGVGVIAAASALERTFRETLDLSALGHIRLRRFHAVRHRLMAGEHGTTTVSEIAHEQGFYELGRFAVEYARLFGEPPSATLRRTFPTSRRVLMVNGVE